MEKKEPEIKKYRVLISTRGMIYRSYLLAENKTFIKWDNTFDARMTHQGNQVNYFIPISE